MASSAAPSSVRRVAVADLGSQAFRLEVAEVDRDGVISSIYRERRPLMLARRGLLCPGDIAEVVDVLGSFARIADQHQAALRVAATAVFRAQPPEIRQALIQGAREDAGVALCILSPRQEAAFSLRGSAGSMGLKGRFLHVEVGGGSSQVSLGEGPELLDTLSIPEGAGSLTRWMDTLTTPCPIARREEAARHAEDIMAPAARFARATNVGVGTGGTAKTLGRLEAILAGRAEPTHRPFYVTRDGLVDVLAELDCWDCPSVGVRRYHLTRDRAEVLRAGALLLCSAMSALGLDRIEVCQDGIRAGVMRADDGTWRRATESSAQP